MYQYNHSKDNYNHSKDNYNHLKDNYILIATKVNILFSIYPSLLVKN